MMSEVKISGVKFQQDFRLDIDLSNGHKVIYNMKPKLVTARFKGIDDWERFCRGRVMNDCRIVWGNDMVEMSLDEILTNVTRMQT